MPRAKDAEQKGQCYPPIRHQKEENMVDKATVQGLLKGAFETHVHAGPDVLPRKFNDIDLAHLAQERGFGGFVLKSHHAITADRATLILAMFPGGKSNGPTAPTTPSGGLTRPPVTARA